MKTISKLKGGGQYGKRTIKNKTNDRNTYLPEIGTGKTCYCE